LPEIPAVVRGNPDVAIPVNADDDDGNGSRVDELPFIILILLAIIFPYFSLILLLLFTSFRHVLVVGARLQQGP